MGLHRPTRNRILGRLGIACLSLIFLGHCTGEQKDNIQSHLKAENGIPDSLDKITGITFTSPPSPIKGDWATQVQRINAEWVAIVPYSFTYSDQSAIRFNGTRQWWGERPSGCIELIKHAKKQHLKIMLKPQVWIVGGWPGDYIPNDIATFERTYTDYITTFLRIADSLEVEMFCVGTEFKHCATMHPKYWEGLIDSARKVYQGKLTYAANWDNYDRITFWDQLDYVGVDAYFPLVNQENPSIQDLMEKWKPYVKALELFSKKVNKPIIFAEYGYRSTDRTTWNQWEHDERNNLSVNEQAQVRAFEALYRSVWNKKWFAGGFIWKWYNHDTAIDPKKDTDYTPQNKKAEAVVSKYYQ